MYLTLPQLTNSLARGGYFAKKSAQSWKMCWLLLSRGMPTAKQTGSAASSSTT